MTARPHPRDVSPPNLGGACGRRLFICDHVCRESRCGVIVRGGLGRSDGRRAVCGGLPGLTTERIGGARPRLARIFCFHLCFWRAVESHGEGACRRLLPGWHRNAVDWVIAINFDLDTGIDVLGCKPKWWMAGPTLACPAMVRRAGGCLERFYLDLPPPPLWVARTSWAMTRGGMGVGWVARFRSA
jgi:hypothetical protein